MKKTAVRLLLMLVAACVVIMFAGCNKNVKNEKVILVVSFGTSVEETLQKTIAATEKRIQSEFPEYRIERAFTSDIIRDIWKKRDVQIPSVDEALGQLQENGVTEVVVQPLHVIPGEEYDEKIIAPVRTFRESGAFESIVVGKPLMYGIEDYDAVIDVLEDEIAALEPTDAYLLMGHGTHHAANAHYACLQLKTDDRKLPYYVGTVEGYPMLDTVEKKLNADNVESVTLLPLMLVAGDHAMNDMAGGEDDSWRSILAAQGYDVSVSMKGMGEYSGIQEIYLSHIHNAITGGGH